MKTGDPHEDLRFLDTEPRSIMEYLDKFRHTIYESSIGRGGHDSFIILMGVKLYENVQRGAGNPHPSRPNHPGHIVSIRMGVFEIQLCEEMHPYYFRLCATEEMLYRYKELQHLTCPFEYQRIKKAEDEKHLMYKIELIRSIFMNIEKLREKHARLQEEADAMLDEIEALEKTVPNDAETLLKEEQLILKKRQNDDTGKRTSHQNTVHGQNKQTDFGSNALHRSFKNLPG
tara:strand:+ start:1910 stop:2599 length:690 start_codon:yes stop_codon:yes gene_type:complete